MNKLYLGDSVYAEMDQWARVILTTENGYGPTNTIILEPEVVHALRLFFSALEQTHQALQNRNP